MANIILNYNDKISFCKKFKYEYKYSKTSYNSATRQWTYTNPARIGWKDDSYSLDSSVSFFGHKITSTAPSSYSSSNSSDYYRYTKTSENSIFYSFTKPGAGDFSYSKITNATFNITINSNNISNTDGIIGYIINSDSYGPSSSASELLNYVSNTSSSSHSFMPNESVVSIDITSIMKAISTTDFNLGFVLGTTSRISNSIDYITISSIELNITYNTNSEITNTGTAAWTTSNGINQMAVTRIAGNYISGNTISCLISGTNASLIKNYDKGGTITFTEAEALTMGILDSSSSCNFTIQFQEYLSGSSEYTIIGTGTYNCSSKISYLAPSASEGAFMATGANLYNINKYIQNYSSLVFTYDSTKMNLHGATINNIKLYYSIDGAPKVLIGTYSARVALDTTLLTYFGGNITYTADITTSRGQTFNSENPYTVLTIEKVYEFSGITDFRVSNFTRVESNNNFSLEIIINYNISIDNELTSIKFDSAPSITSDVEGKTFSNIEIVGTQSGPITITALESPLSGSSTTMYTVGLILSGLNIPYTIEYAYADKLAILDFDSSGRIITFCKGNENDNRSLRSTLGNDMPSCMYTNGVVANGIAVFKRPTIFRENIWFGLETDTGADGTARDVGDSGVWNGSYLEKTTQYGIKFIDNEYFTDSSGNSKLIPSLYTGQINIKRDSTSNVSTWKKYTYLNLLHGNINAFSINIGQHPELICHDLLGNKGELFINGRISTEENKSFTITYGSTMPTADTYGQIGDIYYYINGSVVNQYFYTDLAYKWVKVT